MKTTTKNAWLTAAAVVTAGAAVMVPIVVAYIGSAQNTLIAETQLRRDYVQLAVGILTAPPTAENASLKRWAVALLNKSAPVEMKEPITPSDWMTWSFTRPLN